MNQPQRSHPWQDWHLTAYVLGELKSADAAKIAAAAESDMNLATEIAELRRTIESVRVALDAEESVAAGAVEAQRLGSSGLERALQAAASQTTLSADPAKLPPIFNASSDSHAFAKPATWRRTLIGLFTLASAATLLFLLWRPGGQSNETTITALSHSNQGSSRAGEEKSLDVTSSTTQASVKDATTDAQVAEEVNTAQRSDLTVGVDRSTVAAEPPSAGPSSGVAAERPILSKIPYVNKPKTEPGEVAASEPEGFDHHAPFGDADGLVHEAESPEESDEYIEQLTIAPGNESLAKNTGGYPADNFQSVLGGGGMMGGATPSDSMMGGMGEGGGMEGGGMEGGGMGGGGMGGMGGMRGNAGGAGGGRGGVALSRGLSDSKSNLGGMDGFGSGMGMGISDESRMTVRSPASVELSSRSYASDSSRYGEIVENVFKQVADEPLSTFSIDVDTASYTKCRQLLLELNQRPPANAVRIEEFINYFDYNYAGPEQIDDPEKQAPFAAHLAVAECPWRPKHKLVRIALQAPKVDVSERPAANLVFLLDVSGSMNEPNKLPLVLESMRMLVEQLGENDRVAIVVYAGAAGCVLESTRGDKQTEILAALNRLQAGGSTNGGDGIQLAYNIARDNYIPEGINRVILCTDGDFNVGVTGTEQLVELVVENARSKTFLTVLGFGAGNTNDAMMEEISNDGNGVYGFVDSWREAKRQMVQQLAGNLMTIAKDVKIQVEFNPQRVQSYRLLGYENRIMAAEDFNNDRKDAGEIGAGHRVTALYEIVPVGVTSEGARPEVDDLRYQVQSKAQDAPKDAVETAFPSDERSQELLAVKLRYKAPEGDVSQLRVFPLEDSDENLRNQDVDFRWAAAIAEFGMLLRNSRYNGDSNWRELVKRATAAVGDNDTSREEALQMIRRASQLR